MRCLQATQALRMDWDLYLEIQVSLFLLFEILFNTLCRFKMCIGNADCFSIYMYREWKYQVGVKSYWTKNSDCYSLDVELTLDAFLEWNVYPVNPLAIWSKLHPVLCSHKLLHRDLKEWKNIQKYNCCDNNKIYIIKNCMGHQMSLMIKRWFSTGSRPHGLWPTKPVPL